MAIAVLPVKILSSTTVAAPLSATSLPVAQVWIQSEIGNAGNITIGGAEVAATSGIIINTPSPGPEYFFNNSIINIRSVSLGNGLNLADIFALPVSANDKIRIMYEQV